MMFQLCCVVTFSALALAPFVEGINKKSDDLGLHGNQPVYQNSNGNGPYNGASQYNSNLGVGNGDHHAQQNGASGNGQPGNPQSNLYYYYYPVQDKQKEGPYHNAQASVNQHQSQVSHGDQEHGAGMETAASDSGLSYSTQELGQEYNPQSPQFDREAFNQLASQLQQYGFNQGPGQFDANNPSLNFGGQADASNHIPSQVHPNFNPSMGQQGPLSFSPQGAQFGGQFGGFGGQAVQQQESGLSAGGGIAASLKKYGLSTILMPVLALAGLSMLLPTITSLGTTTTKTKRSIETTDSTISAYIDKVDNYYKLYNKAMEKDDCMNKMICELG